MIGVIAAAGIAFLPGQAAAKDCPTGATPARIGGAEKCLKAGQFCAAKSASEYRKYKFKCVKRGSRYRLVRA